MGWKMRISNENGDQNCPSYGVNSDLFTIKLYHGGKFVQSGGKVVYVGGKENLFDYCTADEMSLLELSNMTAELMLTLSGRLEFYCNKVGVDECGDLVHLRSDTDTLTMCSFVGDEKMLDLFVCDEEFKFGLLNEETVLPTVDEQLPFLGFDFEESSDSDGEMSIGDDSTHSLLYDNDGAYYDEDYKVDGAMDLKELVEQLQEKSMKPWDIGPNERFAGYSGAGRKLYNGFKVFNPVTDMDEVKLEINMCFTSVEVFRDAVRKHAVDGGRTIHLPTNNRNRIQVKCVVPNCPFYVFASTSKDDPTLQIKVIHFEHDCLKKVKTTQADTRFIVKHYGHKIRRNPEWKAERMLAEINDECDVLFHKKQMYRAKRKIQTMDCEDGGQQYKMARRYGKELLRSNPGSTVKIKTRKIGDLRYFKRMYICFGALKAGMRDGCRKVILLDGCHIRTGYGGVILTAIGIDANNSMYPFAYAVVEKEKEKSWLWFLSLVKSDLEITNCVDWMIMSDKQKGLIKAVSIKFEGCEHRFCVMHLYSNFKQKYKGLPLKDLLWKAARATREADFQRAMEEIKQADLKAYDWLSKRPPQNWSKAFFKTLCKSDLLLNNLSESFNSAISKTRMLPILWMLESIRYKIMEQTSMKKQKMLKYKGIICPRIAGIYEKNLSMSTEFGSHWNGNEEFNVQRHEFGTSYRVHVPERFCSCRRWQLTGIPCAHAIVALTRLGRNPEEYIDECYSRDTYLKIYSHYLMTVASMDEWPADDENDLELLPPLIEIQPGRPKKYKRIQQPGEKKGKIIQPPHGPVDQPNENALQFAKRSRSSVILHCSICKKEGHNSKKCPDKPENWVKPDRKRVIPAANKKVQKKSVVDETRVPVEATTVKRPNKLEVRRKVSDWLNYSSTEYGSCSQPNPSSTHGVRVVSCSQPNPSVITSGLGLSQGNGSRFATEATFSNKPVKK